MLTLAHTHSYDRGYFEFLAAFLEADERNDPHNPFEEIQREVALEEEWAADEDRRRLSPLLYKAKQLCSECFALS